MTVATPPNSKIVWLSFKNGSGMYFKHGFANKASTSICGRATRAQVAEKKNRNETTNPELQVVYKGV